MIVSRRTFLTVSGGLALGASLPAAPAWAQQKNIRHFWWGNPERDRRTFAYIDWFQQAHPDIAVSGETIGWGDYWAKMATQTAGRNMADIVQMPYIYLHEYVQRGALVPLDDYLGNGFDVSFYDEGALDSGMVDGMLYGINIGATSQVIPYNQRVFDEAGVAFDRFGWTTDTFADACQKITDATGGAVTGSEDLSLYIENFEVWGRENGHDLYSKDGELQVTAEDVGSYWRFWTDMRKAGIIEGPDATVRVDKPMSDLGIVSGTTATTFRYANQAVAVQSLMQDPVGLAMVPRRAGMAYGQYILPSMYLSISRDAENIDAVLAYINDWVSSPDAIQVLGIDRGIPPSAMGRDALMPVLSDTEAKVVDYYAGIQGKVGPVPNPAPKGVGEVRDSFMRTGTDVVLGYVSPEDGAARFVEDATAILERARM
ncbi:extracellular solute-binding protein [Martelella lutilitoris]|uniref:Extracellular solute-binding protein n=1 Tax=Martelella lutilitoris TaxID=2583532 RepID=A0A5C4JT95_9HYPH|nr:extracellular solute-binding protein [Martelella lutilitoris]